MLDFTPRSLQRRMILACVAATAILSQPARVQAQDAGDAIVLRDGLVIEPVGRYSRSPVHVDAIEAEIVAGRWTPPAAGDRVTLPGGAERVWTAVKAGDDGSLSHNALRGGYVYFAVSAEQQRVVILEAAGHGMVYVNGEPRAGDPYSHGYVHLPVLLRSGSNDLLFHVGRGTLRARLVPPRAAGQIDTSDTTLPDLLVGQPIDTWGAVLVLNTTAQPLSGLSLVTRLTVDDDSPSVVTPQPPLLPLGVRKLPFRLRGPTRAAAGDCELEIKLVQSAGGQPHTLDTARVTLRAVAADQTHKRTFTSDLDGSVQYFAVVPARPRRPTTPPTGEQPQYGSSPSWRYLRPSGAGFATESVVTWSESAEGRDIESVTTRPAQTLTLSAHYDAADRLVSARVTVKDRDAEQTAQVAVKEGKVLVTRADGTSNEFDCPAGTIVTSAPDWTDCVALVRRYDRERGGVQRFPGLWIHATQQPLRLTFTIERVGEEAIAGRGAARLDRYELELRGGSRYVAWGDSTGRLIRLEPKGQPGQAIVLDGFEHAVAGSPVSPKDNRGDDPGGQAGLVLTLHGAGVEALGQAQAYAAKDWAHIVAPTNRRPFGFDWEDWGRLDAIEVLEAAQRQLATDPRRTYLTGHSMGGHGAWHVGLTFPDRFAAVGPSAGWVSMWSYAGARRAQNAGPLEELLMRAATPSDTLALVRNSAQHGVYVLHGEKDDNVPVEQARVMKQQVGAFHKDFVYHEEAGMGHWWGKDLGEFSKDGAAWGTACVDWPPMFEFFAARRIAPRAAVRQVEFVTASPGVSATCHWLVIAAQSEPSKPSSVNVRCEPHERRFVGTTENVARLAIELGHLAPGEMIHVELDGQTIENIARRGDRLWLERQDGHWSVAPAPSPIEKGPHRYGPFKEAFRNRVLFVYGTGGSPEENAWALAKARYDAESFWYRGNGSIDVVPDSAFVGAGPDEPLGDRDRNVILYGNADTNAAWQPLLGSSPVQVRRGQIVIDGAAEPQLTAGDDLACLLVRPRPASDRALVGVVSGTGIAGMRLTDRMPYFVSGVAYPDCIVLGAETLAQGMTGVRVAGFFGVDWSVANGTFVWRQ